MPPMQSREDSVDKHEILRYWIESSDTDYSAMEHLFEKGDYSLGIVFRASCPGKAYEGFLRSECGNQPTTHA